MNLEILFEGVDHSDLLSMSIKKQLGKLEKYSHRGFYGRVNVKGTNHPKTIDVSLYENSAEYHATGQGKSYPEAIKDVQKKLNRQISSQRNKKTVKRKTAA